MTECYVCDKVLLRGHYGIYGHDGVIIPRGGAKGNYQPEVSIYAIMTKQQDLIALITRLINKINNLTQN